MIEDPYAELARSWPIHTTGSVFWTGACLGCGKRFAAAEQRAFCRTCARKNQACELQVKARDLAQTYRNLVKVIRQIAVIDSDPTAYTNLDHEAKVNEEANLIIDKLRLEQEINHILANPV